MTPTKAELAAAKEQMKNAEAFITDLRDLYLKHPHVSNQTTVIAIGELKKREEDAHRAGMLKAADKCDEVKHEPGVSNMSAQAIVCDMCKAAILAAADAKAVNES